VGFRFFAREVPGYGAQHLGVAQEQAKGLALPPRSDWQNEATTGPWLWMKSTWRGDKSAAGRRLSCGGKGCRTFVQPGCSFFHEPIPVLIMMLYRRCVYGPPAVLDTCLMRDRTKAGNDKVRAEAPDGHIVESRAAWASAAE
jgi:hypothetical protein